MPFINTTIDTASLPSAEHIELQPVQPEYKNVLFIGRLIFSLVLLAIAAIFIIILPSIQNAVIAIAAWLVISMLQFFFLNKSFPYLAYAVRDQDVISRKGWIVRTIRVCPFNRIQNCSVQSGPLERRYKLASLLIYTAGSEGADMRISGLQQEEADRLRHFILEKIHAEDHEPI